MVKPSNSVPTIELSQHAEAPTAELHYHEPANHTELEAGLPVHSDDSDWRVISGRNKDDFEMDSESRNLESTTDSDDPPLAPSQPTRKICGHCKR